jgi:cell division protein FtsQ
VPVIAAPADKRFRRAHVKPSRRRGLSPKQAWLAARIAMVLAVTVFGGWRGTALVMGAPALRVSSVSIRGNEQLATGEVLSLVADLRGRNILTIALDDWRQRLLASPWVADATLRRVLPSRIEIAINERDPIGIGRVAGLLYLVDATGVVIDEYGPKYAAFDLPVIDGLSGRSRPADHGVDADRALLASRVIAALATQPALARAVSQIDVSSPHDAVVVLAGETTLLRLGETDFGERIQAYLDLAPALRERVADIEYVDLRFGDRLYVRPAATLRPRARN